MHFEKYKSYSDEAIIQLILNDGQKDLYGLLYSRYQQKVLDKSYSLLRNKELALEARQFIFEKTYEKLSSFQGKSSFSSWLYSITYNYCIDYLRNKKKENYPEWNMRQELPEIIDEIEEEDEINTERLSLLLEMIHPEEKALLIMKYSENMSINEIAKALRLTESATKMRIKRARARVLYLYTKTYLNTKM